MGRLLKKPRTRAIRVERVEGGDIRREQNELEKHLRSGINSVH